jgi:hypothetical protein
VSDIDLAEEVAELREEVRLLREALQAAQGQQVHHYYAPMPWQPQPWQPGWTFQPPATYCVGAAPQPQVLMYNTTCGGLAMVPDYTSVAAGCAGAGAQVYTLQLPAS